LSQTDAAHGTRENASYSKKKGQTDVQAAIAFSSAMKALTTSCNTHTASPSQFRIEVAEF